MLPSRLRPASAFRRTIRKHPPAFWSMERECPMCACCTKALIAWMASTYTTPFKGKFPLIMCLSRRCAAQSRPARYWPVCATYSRDDPITDEPDWPVPNNEMPIQQVVERIEILNLDLAQFWSAAHGWHRSKPQVCSANHVSIGRYRCRPPCAYGFANHPTLSATRNSFSHGLFWVARRRAR